MDILERAEEAYYERQKEIKEMQEEAELQREKDEYRDCGVCDIAEDIVDYFKN